MRTRPILQGLLVLASLPLGACAHGRPTAQSTSSSLAFGHPEKQFFALSVSDLEASAAWYVKVFELERLGGSESPDGSSRNVIVGNDDFVIELIHHRDAKPLAQWSPEANRTYLAYGIFKVGLYVENFDRAVEHLRAQQVDLAGDVRDDPRYGVRFILFRDPDGNFLQLYGETAAGVAR